MSKDKVPANPLFSPSNNFNFSSNALFMPVQEQTSAILSPANDLEEDDFLGNASVTRPEDDAKQVNAATFSLFGSSQEVQSSNIASDAFSSAGLFSVPSTNSALPANVVTTDQQEPQLFVPTSSPSPTTTFLNESGASPLSAYQPVNNMVSLTTQVNHDSPSPPIGHAPPPVNPYAHSSMSGSRHRPMFPHNPQLYQGQQTEQLMPPPVINSPTSIPMLRPQANVVGQSSNNTPPPPPFTPASFERLANTGLNAPDLPTYQPVAPHWFYCKVLSDNNTLWCPFSHEDSHALERAYGSGGSVDTLSTDGGRFDVCISNRERRSVYWDEAPSPIRRCTWFWKSDSDNRFTPYDEALSDELEDEYRDVVTKADWHRRCELPHGEVVIIHGPQLIVHFVPTSQKDEFGSFADTQMSSKVVKRSISSTDLAKDVPESEVGVPDHVVFVCHGIGPVCDLRSRSVVECVDDFRRIHLSLLRSHFSKSCETRRASRIEFLPIHWHRALHGDATGVDRNIRRLTLPSISRLRHFTNETLLDILFYSSPVYCQTIAETIGNEINALHRLFMSRNPHFKGSTSLAGHSLAVVVLSPGHKFFLKMVKMSGSLILFDLLCHQTANGDNAVADHQQPDDLATKATDMSVGDVQQVPATLKKGFSSTASLPSSVKSDRTDPMPPPTTTTTRSLDEVLQQLNLDSFARVFEAEQVDFDSLLMCSESDLKDLGVPMGPRKKLRAFVADHKDKEEKARAEAEEKSRAAEQQLMMLPSQGPAIGDGDFPIGDEAGDNDHALSLNAFDPILSAATNVNVHFQQFDSGTGQPAVQYPQLAFNPQTLFAIGSPIGMFLTVRGIEELGEDFKLPTCDGFINIFHPFDPVAYRVEPLIDPDFDVKPVLVPHHMGRKRMHLELRESIGRMGQELKQGIMRSVRLAIGSMQRFAQNHWNQTGTPTEQSAEVEAEVKSMTEQLLGGGGHDDKAAGENDDTASVMSDVLADAGGNLGRLNGGKRIDYVLQERPLESFNDYLFAFQSHLCYWNNEDTVLLMMKEIYGSMGVSTDRQQQQQQQASHAPPPPLSTAYPTGLPPGPPPNSPYLGGANPEPPPMTNISLG